MARAQLRVRAAGLGAAALSVCATLALALALLAPAAAASPARTAAAASAARTAASAGPPAPAGVDAKAAAIENASSGTLLWSRDLNTERAMGSITKVMTALVVIRAGDLNRTITIPSAVVSYVARYDASSAGLIPGDKLTARQLLAALLLPSGCDAAYALALAYGPGLTAFVARMNATAKSLGLTRTHFANFDGLPWPTEYATYSTAANLLTLGRAAMKSAVFRSIVDQRTWRIAATSAHHAYLWRNLNPLLGAYPGAIGIKTGYTLAAGHCLLFEATRDGRTLIGVTLAGPGTGTTVSGSAATRLLNWGFSRPA